MNRESCITNSTLEFMRIQITRASKLEEKKNIAKRLYLLTNLTITQIAELVDIDEKLLRKELSSICRKNSRIKYKLVQENSLADTLLEQIKENLLTIEDKHK